MSNLKQIGGGHRKNGNKFVDLMLNDPKVRLMYVNIPQNTVIS